MVSEIFDYLNGEVVPEVCADKMMRYMISPLILKMLI